MGEYASFVELDVYRLAEELADLAWSVVLKWEYFAKDTVGKQFVRAADSIGANIAEGHGRRSFVENRRFVRIARASLNETRHWLRRAHRRKLISAEDTEALKGCIHKLAPCINGYLRSLTRRAEAGPTRPNAPQPTNQRRTN